MSAAADNYSSSQFPEPALVPELAVTDLATSLSFYLAKLGFRIRYQREAEGFAYLEREGAELMLDQLNLGRSWLTGSMQQPFGRGVNLQIKVSDVAELRRGIDDEAIFLDLETRWYAGSDVEYGVKQFVVRDPDGYLLRLQQSLGTRPRQRP
ncbi:MAG: bleomycin resistance family protein [Propionibacterium sp.]|nr:MAG: bleomycin resistance family protein [Propionibacterium sp.]